MRFSKYLGLNGSNHNGAEGQQEERQEEKIIANIFEQLQSSNYKSSLI